MELVLNRNVSACKGKRYTEGQLSVNGKYLCDTLEPQWRNISSLHPGKKVKGRTAIPAGRYAVTITYSPKFGRWLPLLLHVPLFTGIRIHEGNTVEDTAGCILLGKKSNEGVLCYSRCWMRRFMELLDARPEGEPIWITVR